MKKCIMSFLLILVLGLITCYQSGCIGYTKHYKWEPTERETEEIIERAAEKMVEAQKSQK